MEMGFPITQTKILVPRRRNDILTRQRLLDTLYEQLDHKLIIVVAPAGYGKTSLLIDFAHHTEWPFCWYSLDNLDREPQQFLAHLIASIALQFPNFGKRSQAILQNMVSGELNLDSMVSVIVNDIYENITEHFVIVLDDYHLIDTSKPVAYFISRLIQDTDENCHIFLSSRTLISLPELPLMVARSLVGGVSFEDLAFNANEIQGLLLQNYHQTLSDSTAKELVRQSDGWITGLLLSSQMIRQGLADRLSLGKASGIGLYDYLAEQVLDQQPPDIKDFILRTSLLDEFDAEFCEEIIGTALSIHENWNELIENLYHSNLFVLPIGEERIWLRYHHLFREFLRSRILKDRPEEAEKILSRLADVYQQRGEWEHTYELYYRLGKTNDLIALVEKAGTLLISKGRLITLQEWLEALPADSLRNNPALLSLQGSVQMMRGEARRGLELINRAINMINGESDRTLLAATLVRRATIYFSLGDYQQELEDADRALSLCENNLGCGDHPETGWVIPEALRLKGMALYRLGLFNSAIENLTTSIELYKKVGDEQSVATLWMELGIVHIATGNYLAAEQTYSMALDFWQKTNNATWLANLLNNLGDLQRLMQNFEAAIATLEKAIQYSQMSGYMRLEAYSLASIGDLYADLDANEQALEAVRKSRALASRIQDQYLLICLDLAEAIYSNRRGNTLHASKLLENARKVAGSGGSGYEQNMVRLETCRIRLVNKDFKNAIHEIANAGSYFEQEGLAVISLRAQLYQAIAQFELRHEPSAREELKQVLSRVVEPKAMTALLSYIRELRHYIEPMKKDPEISSLSIYLLQEIDRFDQSSTILRKHLRRRATVIPFAPAKMSIQALGKMQVKINDRIITIADWQTQTARNLFFFLLARQDGITKEAVGEVFWLESSPAELKMRFKNTIYRLRHAAGKDVIIFQDDNYRFNTALDYEYDVESFIKEIYHAELATDRQQKIISYQTALKCYQGPYLPEGDDTWILSERQKIYNIFINALLKLTMIYLEGKEYDEALDLCQKILGEDPCMEDAHRLAMRIYAAMGNRAAIARQYEYCRQVLSEELNATPSSITQSLFETLMR
jgi:LuxR family transcriptional regulator, maltose regulon positive regulatory protein